MLDKNNKISDGDYLEFEDKVADLDRQINELRRLIAIKGIDYSTEIRRLQQELAVVEEEREILKKALNIFSRKSG